MTPEEREEIYDDEIATALADIAKRCQDLGMSIVASVEFAPGSYGTTRALAASAGFGIRMTDVAARSFGNVDTMMLAVQKHAIEHGHGSIILAQLGIPTAPAPADAGRTS